VSADRHYKPNLLTAQDLLAVHSFSEAHAAICYVMPPCPPALLKSHMPTDDANLFKRRPTPGLCLGCRYSLETSLLNSRDSDVAQADVSYPFGTSWTVRTIVALSDLNSLLGLE
ncbi:hypothetical protein Tco_0902323, partial [Tanacetum coccineum]